MPETNATTGEKKGDVRTSGERMGAQEGYQYWNRATGRDCGTGAGIRDARDNRRGSGDGGGVNDGDATYSQAIGQGHDGVE